MVPISDHQGGFQSPDWTNHAVDVDFTWQRTCGTGRDVHTAPTGRSIGAFHSSAGIPTTCIDQLRTPDMASRSLSSWWSSASSPSSPAFCSLRSAAPRNLPPGRPLESRGSPNWMCSSLSASPGEMASTRARRSASHVDSNRLSTNPVVDLPLEGRTFGAAGSRSELGFRKAGNA